MFLGFFFVSKRFLRGDFLNFGVINGELVEIEVKKIVINLIDLNVVKQDILKLDGVVGSVLGIELVELRVDILGEKGNKVFISLQDEVLVGFLVIVDCLYEMLSVGLKVNMDIVDVGDQFLLLVFELYVLLFLVLLNFMDLVEEKFKYYMIFSYVGRKWLYV